MENVWEYLCGNKLRAVVRDTDDAIVAPWRQAWTFLTDDPDRVRSIGTRDWASVNGQDGWYETGPGAADRSASRSVVPCSYGPCSSGPRSSGWPRRRRRN